MKIALIGYGKMGQAIEKIALSENHEIVLKIDAANLAELTIENLQKADVAIEFTHPESAIANIQTCFKAGIPVVCGTTGWLQHLPQVQTECLQQNGTMLQATNFSIGVNIFFAVNQYLAKLMRPRANYDVSITEIHHTAKQDAPSGTAITLAEGIINNHSLKKHWVNAITSNTAELQITSERIDPAPGTHMVKYTSVIDDIEIIHTAHNRMGFASGAVAAAAYIYNKKGIFTMNDVLGL